MGEFSKKVGEYGESVAGELLDLIGWRNRQAGIDVDCIDDDHTNKLHGIDAQFSYKSPLTDKMLDICCISIKFTTKGYPDSPKSVFKNHISDLSNALDCYSRSGGVRKIKSKAVGVNGSSLSGILIWLHNREDKKDGVLSDLQDIKYPSTAKFEKPIYVVDNERAKFLFNAHQYFKINKSDSQRVEYFYQKTGNNNSDTDKVSSGKVLPIELICSDILIFKVTDKDANVRLVFIVNEEFSESSLRRLVGLSHEVSQGLTSEIDILFTTYNPIVNDNEVKQVKAELPDYDFAQKISVNSYIDGLV